MTHIDFDNIKTLRARPIITGEWALEGSPKRTYDKFTCRNFGFLHEYFSSLEELKIFVDLNFKNVNLIVVTYDEMLKHYDEYKTVLMKAFEALKMRFNLVDIRVGFWSYGSHPYKVRPYVYVVRKGNDILELCMKDTFFVYADEFDKPKYRSSSPSEKPQCKIEPWQIMKTLFKRAQKTDIYLFPKNNYYIPTFESQYIFMRKGSNPYMFIIEHDLMS